MNKYIFTLIVLFFSLTATAESLTFANGYRAEVNWLTGPHRPQASTLKVEWYDKNQARAEAPGEFKVVLWMPQHGHGSSPTRVAKFGQEIGVYEATNLYFTMGGRWEVRVVLKSETQSFAVTLPGGGQHH